jgi:hypothetical protein
VLEVALGACVLGLSCCLLRCAAHYPYTPGLLGGDFPRLIHRRPTAYISVMPTGVVLLPLANNHLRSLPVLMRSAMYHVYNIIFTVQLL